MHSFKLVLFIQYDGTDFYGFQRQPDVSTIQGELEKALSHLTDQKFNLAGSGRTDRGVHAREQVISIKTEKKIDIPLEKIPSVLNGRLPRGILVTKAKRASHQFHARFYARSRRYSYQIITHPDVFASRYATSIRYKIDKDILFKSADIFLGEHDFTTFSKYNKDTETYVCNVKDSYWEEISESHYIYNVKANRFVYSMVRSLVGAMLDAARGYRTIDELVEAFKNKERDFYINMAPPQGLCLEEITYPEEYDYFQKPNEEYFEDDEVEEG